MDEGFAEYMSGVWDSAGVSEVRTLAATQIAPLDNGPQEPAVKASLGHAAFDFIEAEYGKAAVWQFLVEVRRMVVEGTGDPYRAAFNRSSAEFDAAFASYLRKRFN
jgi:hypothetical protein